MTAARPTPPTDLTAGPRAEIPVDARYKPRNPGARGRLRGAAGVVAAALSVGVAAAVPTVAAAAPAPCEQAQDYAAESGAQLFHVGTFDPRAAGAHGKPSSDVGLGESRSAMVSEATVNSAAVTRLLDAAKAGKPAEPLVQSAPPTNPEAAKSTFAAAGAGPFAWGNSTLTSHAEWDPRMACAARTGEITRAEAALVEAAVGGRLVRVPEKTGSLSTTKLAASARSVATAGVTVRGLELLDGAVRVRVVRQPTLVTGMSTAKGGTVRYTAPVLEVSGDGIRTTRLDAAGQEVELAVTDGEEGDQPADESAGPARGGPAQGGSAQGGPAQGGPAQGSPGKGGQAKGGQAKGGQAKGGQAEDGQAEGGQAKGGQATGSAGSKVTGTPEAGDRTSATGGLGALLDRLPKLGSLTKSSPLPVPTVPNLPPVSDPAAESAKVTGPGTRVRIALGTAQQAEKGHTIAARATAITIAITEGGSPSRGQTGYGDHTPKPGGVVLDLNVGVLEAAAVAPESGGGVQGASSGSGGGLPITGPGAGGLALAGGALLLLGAGAVTLAARRRRLRIES
jgi:hypothetical protein